jgi:hypothetical protein
MMSTDEGLAKDRHAEGSDHLEPPGEMFWA